MSMPHEPLTPEERTLAQSRFHGFPAHAGDLADLLQGQFLLQPEQHYFSLFRLEQELTLEEIGEITGVGLSLIHI